jgi:hypothetical protein
MGPACWDLNANLQCDVGTEDMDGDGGCDNDDCQGFTGMYMVQNTQAVAVIGGGPFDVTLQQLCNVGDVATGGGAGIENEITIGTANIIFDAPVPLLAMPTSPPIGWVARVVGNGPANFDFSIWAICISDPNN